MNSQMTPPELGGVNPYDYLPATPSQFVGRWSDVNRIASDLAYGSSSYGCIGGRRCGKTSMLRMVEHTLHNDPKFSGRTVCLYEDPMGHRFVSPEHVFATLLRHLCDCVELRFVQSREQPTQPRVDLSDISVYNATVDAVFSGTNPEITAEQFGQFVNAIHGKLEDIGGPRRLVILIDEMENFLKYPWQTDLYEQLRACIASGPARDRLRVVLAGSKGFLTAPGYQGSPLMNVLEHIYLSSFDEAAIADLCAKAPDMSDEIRQAIWQQSGGHPYIATYLLKNLIDSGQKQASVADIQNLGLKFVQEESLHLETWSHAVGLVGLQVYGLYLDADGWLDRQSIVRRVADPKLNVSEALNALSYHCLAFRNRISTRFTIGGTIFRTWYHNEIARLVEELEPAVTDTPGLPKFFLQLIQNGPLTAAFGSHAVAVGHDVSGATIVTGSENVLQQATGEGVSQSAKSPDAESSKGSLETVSAKELRLLVIRAHRATAAAIAAGELNDELAIDLEYHLKKASLEISKETCNFLSVSEFLQHALSAIYEHQNVPDRVIVSIRYITQLLEQ